MVVGHLKEEEFKARINIDRKRQIVTDEKVQIKKEHVWGEH